MRLFLARLGLRLLRIIPGLVGFVLVVGFFVGGIWLMNISFENWRPDNLVITIVSGAWPIVWAFGFAAVALFLTPWLVENKIPSSKWYLRTQKRLRRRLRVRVS